MTGVLHSGQPLVNPALETSEASGEKDTTGSEISQEGVMNDALNVGTKTSM